MKINKTTALAAALTILVSCSSVSTSQRATDAPLGNTETKAEALEFDHDLNPLLEDWAFSGSILVATGGDVLLHNAYDFGGKPEAGPFTTDRPYAIASMTKSFTAVLALQLIENGQLSLDESISDHLPAYAAPYRDRVTVRDLLQNRSGIPHYIDIPGWFEVEYKSTLTQAGFVDAIAKLPLKFEPGTDKLYSNANYFLLGLIVEAASGKSYEQALKDQILSPLEMSATGQIYEDAPAPTLVQNYLREDDGSLNPIPVTNPKLFKATASMYSTTGDLRKWSNALFTNQLLKPESKDLLFSSDLPMAWTVGAFPMPDESLVQVRTYNGELIGYNSMITQLPQQDSVIIILNNNGVGYENLSALTYQIAVKLEE
ncbi:MAG: serine hydrolase domain-containing protein [Henriciella sp.]|jgi:CubicO group peptidase (beta-lactamase class C family)